MSIARHHAEWLPLVEASGLWYYVRRAVEVQVQALDRIDQDRNRTLVQNISEPQLYEAALTVMMRLVFLFSAEERKLIP